MSNVQAYLLVCNVIAIVAGVMATFMSKVRWVTLSLWVCGLALGGSFLALSVEFVALVQWLLATLVALCFLIFSGLMEREAGAREVKRIIPAVGIGCLTAAAMYVGAREMFDFSLSFEPAGDLVRVGKELIDRYFIYLLVVTFTFTIVLVGVGVISRPEGEVDEW